MLLNIYNLSSDRVKILQPHHHENINSKLNTIKTSTDKQKNGDHTGYKNYWHKIYTLILLT